jgi:hypothetical protein
VIDSHPQANDPPISDADKMVAQERESQQSDASRTVTRDDVRRLADALRAAKRAHAAYIAELRQADVDPAEHWSTWYAEYLLGVR